MCRTKHRFSSPAMTMLLPGTSQSFSPMFTVCQGLCFHTHGFNCPLHTWMSSQLTPELQNNIFSSLLVVFIWTYRRHVLRKMPDCSCNIPPEAKPPTVPIWVNGPTVSLRPQPETSTSSVSLIRSQTLLILNNSSVFLISTPCTSCLSLVPEPIPF